jgi:hypothetical protein
MKVHINISAWIFLFSSLLIAQSGGAGVDPFLGHSTLGGRSDLILFNAHPDYGFEIGYSTFSNDTASHPLMYSVSINKIISSDGVSGSFLVSTPADQSRDEAVCGTMESIGDSSVIVKLYVAQLINGSWSVASATIDSVKAKASIVPQRMEIRMTSGYFDGGEAKDFAIAYNLPDGNQLITIKAFRLDDFSFSPVQITSASADVLSSSLGAQAFFDITAGDFDGDGLDEIVLVKNNALTSVSGTNCTVSLNFHAYDFDWTSKQLVSKGSQNTSWNVPVSLTTQSPLVQLVIGAGDFLGTGKDEGVCAFATNYIPLTQNLVQYTARPFQLSSDLMSFVFGGTSPLSFKSENIGAVHGNLISTVSMALPICDIDRDGKDDFICTCMSTIFILHLNPDLTFETSVQWNIAWNSKLEYDSHRLLAITDIDGDTTFADSLNSIFHPEIITSEFTLDPRTQITSGSNNYHQIKVYKLFDPVKLNGLYSDLIENYAGALSPTAMTGGGIIPAYLHGFKITLGKPTLKVVKNLVEPVIILNAPPIHFDVFNNTSYDICNSYPINSSNSLFYSQLVQSSTHEAEVTTNVHSSWGVSATLSAEAKFLGIGVSASLTAKYGKDFSNTQRTDSTMSTTQTDLTTWDDLIYATVTNYDLWEYPVYAYGVKKGNIMAAISHPQTAKWFQCNDGNFGNNINLGHEPGNLLSYPTYGTPSENSDLGSLIYAGDSYSISPTGSVHNWDLNWQKITQSSAATTSSYGFAASASVEGWGVKLEVEGNYDHSDMNTHTTTVTQSVNMTANMGTINPLFASAGYGLEPYAYWSNKGPLVLGYIVDLPTSGIFSFWQDNYSQNPDLTFNCYYRYFAQKGLASLRPEMADWTKEIQISPETPKQGDTVTVMAMIHNYSLMATSGPVQVRFYFGSSETGGKTVRSLNGDTVFTTSSPVPARGDQIFQFKWRIPSGISSSDSILYAAIDPNNSITELKEDNNKAWNRLTIIGVTAVDQSSPVLTSFGLSQNYPNPFNSSSVIKYSIPTSSHVTLKIFNALGEEIKTLVNEEKHVGSYEINWNAVNLPSGVYFYRLQAGSFVKTKKMILLK